MRIGAKQRLFARLYPRLILKAHALGFEVTLGMLQRTTAEAKRLGFRRSLHVLKIAGDLNLFRNGRYLKRTAAHAELGEWWKRQHPLCRWGGDFSSPDGNHYSLAHAGRA